MKVQLQSILLPTDDVCTIPELYFHKAEKRIDFDGYFNLFYIEKRKAYTQIEELSLDIFLKGYDELLIMYNQKELKRVKLTADTVMGYSFELPYLDYENGVFWFALIENADVAEKKATGYYCGTIADNKFRPINIGINICTFKREAYVAKTLRKLSEKLINNTELNVAGHMQVFVIDNGRTLKDYQEAQKIKAESTRIHIIPNMNAGGSGGFTRGMIEILNRKEQDGFTHVLMMDDDAIVEPDTLVRLYGFLTTVKDGWKNITVGGALLREEYPYILFCAGEWWENGYIISNPDYNLDLRDRDQASCDYLTRCGNEFNQYSGWWCCCYSLNIVRDDNLPIPFFIHHDDIEYGIRNRNAGIVFLNGINIWHRDVELGMPGANTYYDVRNTLIEMALQNVGGLAAVKCVCRRFVGAILRYRYQDAELVCRGVKDYLKGTAWLYAQKPEELHKEICSMAYKAIKLEELINLLPKREYDSVINQMEVIRKKMQQCFWGLKVAVTKVKWRHLITFNGWVLPAIEGIKVIQIEDSAFEAFRRKRVVLYNTSEEKVLLFERKYSQLIRVLMLFLKELWRLIQDYRCVSEDYRCNNGKNTNKAFWENFLGLH